jgi:hypothetical protein
VHRAIIIVYDYSIKISCFHHQLCVQNGEK